MAVVITAKVNAVNNSLGANGTLTATGLTTSGPSMILVKSAIGNNTASSVASATVNGNAMALARKQVSSDTTSNAEVWFWWSPAALASVSVVVNYTNTAGAGALILVEESTGTDSNSIGNTGGANGTSGTTAAGAVCSANNSVMTSSALDFGNTNTAGTNTSIISSLNDAAGDFLTSAQNTQTTSSGTTYTITTTHTSNQWGIAVVEIKPAATVAPSVGISTSIPPFFMVGPGRFRPGPRFRSQTFSTDRTVGIAGAMGTSAPGTLPPTIAVTTTGVSATSSSGSVTQSLAIGLTSPQLSTSAGNVTTGNDVTLSITGNSATAATGTLTPSTTVNSTTGASGTSTAGTAAPVFAFGLTGASVTASSGTPGVSGTVGVTGSAGAGTAGSISTIPRFVPIVATPRGFKQGGQYRFIQMRTVWAAMMGSAAEHAALIADCVAEGYDGIEIGAIWRDGATRSTRAPFANDGADLPFTTKLGGGAWTGSTVDPDFTTPNTNYWNRFLALVDGFATVNKLVKAFPGYTGTSGGGGSTPDDGWANEMVRNGPTNMQTYGAWIANLCKDRANIIWGLGGDSGTTNRPFTGSELAAELAMVNGMLSVSGQLSTNFGAEWATDSIGDDQTDFLNGVSGPTLGSTLTIQTLYNFFGGFIPLAKRGFAQGTKPTGVQEGPFADEDQITGTGFNAAATPRVSRFYWWAWTSGAFSMINLGNGWVWPFNKTGSPPLGNWQSFLNRQGDLELQVLANFARSVPFWKLIPTGTSGMRTLIVANAGSGTGRNDDGPAGGETTTVSAACADDGSFAVAYRPRAHGTTFDFDPRSLKRPYAGYWLDTGNGATTPITGVFSNLVSAQTFTPPGTNSAGETDWLLVLTAQADYGAIPAASFNVVGPGRLRSPTGVGRSISFASAATSTPGGAALTGASGTSATGTPGVAFTLGATGVSASSASGTSTPATSAGVTGSSGASAAGTPSVSDAVAATGSAAAATAGTAGPATAIGTTGASGTSALGSATPISTAVTTGAGATSSPGTLGASITIPITGNTATSAAGTMSASSPGTAAVSGSGGTSTAGALGPTLTLAATGASATTSAGSLSPGLSIGAAGTSISAAAGNQTPALTAGASGAAAAAGAGHPLAALALSVTSAGSTSTAGTVTPSAGTSAVLTGASATTQAGTTAVTMTSTVGLTGALFTVTAGSLSSGTPPAPRSRVGAGPTRAINRSGGPTKSGRS